MDSLYNIKPDYTVRHKHWNTHELLSHQIMSHETRMDLSLFDEKYKNDETGRFAYDPKILLKVVLFAYSRRNFSSYSSP